MKKIVISSMLYLLLLGGALEAAAQKTSIKGTIVSATDKTPVIGATVVEQDKNKRIINAATTNYDGEFTLTLSTAKTQVTVSYIGCKTINTNVDANTKKRYDFALEDDVVNLQMVEVVAEARSTNTLMPVSYKDMAISVGKLQLQDVAESPATSVAEMLQGRISGVDITSSSGNPGAGLSIRIRGASSLNGSSDPLIVVDGIPYETKIDSKINFSTVTDEEFGAMLDISPSDILTVEVLKDAAASAVWGSRGANGVLLITTKRGSKGRTSFDYDVKLTSNWEPSSIPMLNGDQYAMLQLEALFNANGIVTIPNELAYDKMWNNYHNYAQNTDWVKAMSKTAFMHDHNFSLRGGGEKARYRIAAGYLGQDGTSIGTSLTRFTTRMNVDYDLSNQLRLSTDISYTNMSNDRHLSDSDMGIADRGGIRSLAYRKAPNMALYELNADGHSTGKYFAPENTYQGSGNSYYNPVAMALDGINKLKSDRVISKFSLRYYLLPEVLMYQGDVAFDFMSNNTLTFVPQTATGASWTTTNMNRSSKKDEEARTTQTFNKLVFTPKLGENHRVTFLGMVSSYEKKNSNMSTRGSNTPSSSIIDPGFEARKSSLSSGKNSIRNVSGLLNVNYVMLGRYILSGSVRTDGDSRFGLASRWGYFPSVSAAWNLGNESFMKSLSVVDEFKIKASYGETGTPPPTTYGFLAKYAAGNNYMDMSSIVPSNIQLDKLKWETVIQKNIGLDFSFLKGKITGNFDVYNKVTKDVIFIDTQLPSTSGFGRLEAQNWGTIENRGWEFNTSIEVFKSKDWSVAFNGNLAQNKNYIIDIPNGYATEKYTYENGQYARRIQEGKPMGSFFGYRYLGVYARNEDAYIRDEKGQVMINPNTGDPIVMRPKLGSSGFVGGDAKYDDRDKNGVIDERDMVYLGDSNPLITGGFGVNVAWKNFALSTFFHFKYDFDVVNATRMNAESMYNRDNQSLATLSRWRKPGDETNVPRALLGQGFNWLGSDRFVEDASYLRLKTISLSYKFDNSMLAKANIKGLKVFLTAYNLFTWTKYTGQDPEVYLRGGDPFAIAVDNSRTPPAQSITVGANISF